jgi:hypothetical protein
MYPTIAEERETILEILKLYPEGMKIKLKYRSNPLTFTGELYEQKIRHGSGTYLCRELEGNGRKYRLQMMKRGDGTPWLSLYYPDGHEDSLCDEEHCKWSKIERAPKIWHTGKLCKSVCKWNEGLQHRASTP